MEVDEPAQAGPSQRDKGKGKVGGGPSRQEKGKATLREGARGDGVWVEKYRPKALSDVAAHKDIIDTISRLTKENRLPHLLLYGPPGTGKTSTILAVARELYGAKDYQNMTLELNASDDRGIDVVRQQIQDFASTRNMFSSGFKLVILDEADAMTKDAQFSLRRVIEKYTRNTRFCLICNYVSKIIPALQSRCTRFRFAPLDATHVTERLQHIVDEERLDVSENGLPAVVRLANGDMRKALNILQSTHMSSPFIDEKAVYLCTGNPLPSDIEKIAHWLLNEPFTVAHDRIIEMKTLKGLALVDIVRELQPWIFRISMPATTRIMVVDALSNIEYRLAFGTSEKLQLGALVGAFTKARIQLIAAAE
jgi:replication factor C subunit 3/5